MRRIAKKIVLWLLKGLAKHRLRKFRGKIIAVTGSLGKTSTKEAIYTVLNSQFKVKKNEGSMNSEFGLLLTILDIPSGYSSAAKWSWYLLKGFVHALMRDHSEILLLEFGVDKPKDMNFLISVVKPDMVVMTSIAPVHLDEGQFSSLEEVFEEKMKLAEAVKKDGIVLFNVDNSYLHSAYKKFDKKQRVGYGLAKEADYWAGRIQHSLEGVAFTLHHKEEKLQLQAKVLGDYQVYVLMPAAICGLKLGMMPEQVAVAMERYQLPPGRMSLIEGVNESMILDSTYNSSPIALREALKVLAEVGEGSRRIAVLGNMNELGERSQELHEMIGKVVPSCAEMLVTVGNQAAFIADKALERGMAEENVHKFNSTPEAMEFLKPLVKKGDLILVKGSQNRVRLERLVKEIMLRPEEAKDLLVRQSKVWEAKL